MSVVEIFEREQLSEPSPVARLYALPVLRDDLARIHGWIISPPGTVRPFSLAILLTPHFTGWRNGRSAPIFCEEN